MTDAITTIAGRNGARLQFRKFTATGQRRRGIMAFQTVHAVNEARASRKARQAFYTPLGLVEEMIKQTNIYSGALCLEPSAGDGRIVHALISRGATVHACEIDDAMRAKCTREGAEIIGTDFLAVEPNPVYAFVLMNPPFTGRQYQEHIEHAYKFLHPGGRLRAIAPANADAEVNQALWNLPGCVNASFERIGKNAFRSEGTAVDTILVRVDAPSDQDGELFMGYKNYATGSAIIACTSDRQTYEAIHGDTSADVNTCRSVCLRYLSQHGATAYGVDWHEVFEEMTAKDY